MRLTKSSFRAYDIRGVYGLDIDEKGFFVLGQKLAKYFQKKFSRKNIIIFVSKDGRLHSQKLMNELILGISQYPEIHTITSKESVVPTPINIFTLHDKNDIDIALQITASHNPKEYNGLKISTKQGAIHGNEIQKILHQSVTELGVQKNFRENFLKIMPITDSYQRAIMKQGIQGNASLVVDGSNGAASIIYPKVFESLGFSVQKIFCEIDGNFPNHPPDPSDIKNLKILQEKMIQGNYDFGVAFDGDGDRFSIFLSDGYWINADKITYILAQDLLRRYNSPTIIMDIMSSELVIQKLKNEGANVMLAKTGHSNIEEAMRKNKALLGGEQSGHFMLHENWFGNDDALLASLRVINYITKNPNIIQKIKSWEMRYEFISEFTVTESQKFQILDTYIQELKKEFGAGDMTDGWRKTWENNSDFCIVRASNTTPKISVRFDSSNKLFLKKFREKIHQIFKSIQKTTRNI